MSDYYYFLLFYTHSYSQVPGPMAEIDFWRERTAILSALSEQLKLPVVKKILEVMTKADPVTVQNLDLTVTELSKLHVESVENVRFLSTLERHFKVGIEKETLFSPNLTLWQKHSMYN